MGFAAGGGAAPDRGHPSSTSSTGRASRRCRRPSTTAGNAIDQFKCYDFEMWFRVDPAFAVPFAAWNAVVAIAKDTLVTNGRRAPAMVVPYPNLLHVNRKKNCMQRHTHVCGGSSYLEVVQGMSPPVLVTEIQRCYSDSPRPCCPK